MMLSFSSILFVMLLSQCIISIISNECLSIMIVSAAESIVNAKQGVVCSGDYYFNINNENGKIDSHLPPPNIVCDIINGSLVLNGYNATYAKHIPKSIKSIKTINGTISLQYLKEYPPFLQTISAIGTLHLYHVRYGNSWTLKQISSIRSKIEIYNNDNVRLSFPNLIELGGLDLFYSSVASINIPQIVESGSIAIGYNTGLQSLFMLKNINKLYGNLEVYDSSLSSFGMDSITSIKGNLIFSANRAAFLNIIFPNGVDIGGDFSLTENKGDKSNNTISIKVQNGSMNIHGSLKVSYNFGLVDLSGLGKVKIGNSISVDGNYGKIVMFDVSEITQLSGSVYISNYGSMDYPVFVSLQSIGSLELPSKTKQDYSMEKYYPKLKRVEGTVYIHRCNSLVNLGVLKFLDHIGLLNIDTNDNLMNLEGLEKIKTLEYLYIETNKNLISLKGLDNLVRVDGRMIIHGNANLNSLDGLNNLVNVGPTDIQTNIKLKSLNGLSSLVSINGTLSLYGNQALTTTKGLDSLEQVESIYMYLQSQQKLKDIVFGKKKSTLGYPEVEIYGIDEAKHLNINKIKKIFKLICQTTNIADKTTFVCNQ